MTLTHSKVRQKKSSEFSKLPGTRPIERFERNDFLSSLSNSDFFQTLSGKYPAVLWKPNSTRPDEPMKDEVLIPSSLIPKNLFAIWRRYFRHRLQHFSTVGDTAFYAFKERIQQETFRNDFFVLIVTGLWVKPFLIFGRNFQSVVNIAFYVSKWRL